MKGHAMLELAPLHALDALEDAERSSFELHLDGCERCQVAVFEYQEVASGLVPDETASDHGWDRIRAAVSGSRQADVIPLRAREPSRPWRWVSAASAVAALAFGGILVAQLVDQSAITEDRIVMAAEEARGESGSVTGDFLVDGAVVAQVVLAEDGHGYVIPTNSLEMLEAARTYQLWVINDSEEAVSAGVLGSDPTPATFTWTGSVTGFALTREVAGGVVASEGDVVAVVTGL